MTQEPKSRNIGGGLQALPKDDRDFSFGAIFGLPKLEELPDEYIVGKPIRIKDQGNTDMCTAYALTAVSEDQELVELNPFYTFGKTKQIMGDWESWGADLRSACKSAVDYGFIPTDGIIKVPDDEDRDKAANWANWPQESDQQAARHKKRSYFAVTGQYDTFDNLRATLWQNRAEERSVLAGCTWRQEWTRASGGIVPYIYGNGGFGHAFKIFGWKKILTAYSRVDGGEQFFETYLMAQLSNGTEIGEDGIFYFPREVVNKEFTFGLFTFKDMPREEAEYLHKKKLAGFVGRILLAISAFFAKF